QAWARGNVLSWDEWLRSLGELVLWSGYASPSGRRRLLSPLQEQILWERILAETAPSAPLNVGGTARLARSAWQMLHQWRMPDPGTVGFTSAEQGAFSRWMERYHSYCTDNSWLDSARVIDSLVPAIGSGAVSVPAHVLLAGFDGFNPQQRSLLRVLASMGTQLSMERRGQAENKAGLLTSPNADTELQTAVRWLRGLVVNDVTRRACLVVPDLANSFLRVERALDKALLPSASLPGAPSESTRPYEIGAGRPLRKQPVVVAADHVLALSMGSVSMRVLSRIIRSPFIAGGITEAARRARFDAGIRDKGSVDVDLRHMPDMLKAFRQQTGVPTDDFALETLFKSLSGRKDDQVARSPSAWGADFNSRLELFGWPGEGQQDAIQRQAQRDFEDLLREFCSLDDVLGELSPPEALRVLRHLLRGRHFEFHAPNVPISVLEPADAEWLSFDHLWICNAAGGNWSRIIGTPNPFIPIEWQRDCKLPESAPASRAQRADQLTTRLMSSASQVVVSKVENSDQGFMLKSFSSVPQISLQQLELADLTDYRQALVAATDIDTVQDDRGPALDPVESIDLNQEVLTLQSACPFRSFAINRLGAKPLRALRPGIRPEARVVLVRMALEHLWHRIESSDVLQAALSGEHLEVQIWEVADTVLAVFERKLPVRLSTRYRALEHARLVRLLLQWLPVEAGRAPFVVNQTDVSANIDIGGVAIRAHVDRVDQVDGQGLVAIDYDTERFEPERWTGDRPDAPTLLLYALATEEKPVALLTGCVVDERMDLSGVQQASVVSRLPLYAQSELAAQTGLSWDALLKHARETLEALTRQFATGDASVAPKYGTDTCNSCHLSSLCRIGEQKVF
ncbi:MAG: PD-(D/E)XK nuclease family protein, partial [Gammaproteobacteria bacterium]|nr:PD-(D/E)XK nuclease family protein [Gammaproteobacteria bacterium]